MDDNEKSTFNLTSDFKLLVIKYMFLLYRDPNYMCILIVQVIVG